MEGITRILKGCVVFLKISTFFLFVLFLPHFVLFHKEPEAVTPTLPSHAMTLGVENITANFLARLSPHDRPYKAAILTNHTGKDQHGNRNIDLLIQKGVKLTAILVPQHGFYANNSSPANDTNADIKTQLPVIPWYDKQKKHTAILASTDVLFYDLQDSGMRHGYVSTLLNVMKEVAKYKKKLVVLDRPNPLGSGMEGYASKDLEGITTNKLPIPVRHGMTTGEIARYFNENVLESPIQLQIVPMQNYTRSRITTRLPSPISPNLKTVNACYGHSLLGLLGEITPFDIGIGTDHPFQCLLLPDRLQVKKKTWFTLQAMLKEKGVDSTFYRCWHTRKKQYYSGLQLSIRDINSFSSYSSLLTIIDFFTHKGISLTFSKQFDRAVGTDKIREYAQGSLSRQELEATLYEGIKHFFSKASSSLLYQPAPKIMRL